MQGSAKSFFSKMKQNIWSIKITKKKNLIFYKIPIELFRNQMFHFEITFWYISAILLKQKLVITKKSSN